jgi:hypothetical protein
MNLNRWITHWAEATPNKPAIIFGDQQYSYSSLAIVIPGAFHGLIYRHRRL